jgi:D-alanyl-D-alanine-carboxypeptidase/D-alanyl-D-alanine-endopeptidase
MTTITRLICFAGLIWAVRVPAVAQSGFTDAEAEAIKAFLRDNFGQTNTCMVVGLVDERGSRIYSGGKMENGSIQEVNGDTVFEIGSVTKTFTALLLLDLVEREEMKLEDPVVKYLPSSVKMPSRGGKEITLLNLAAQDSGLPFNPDNLKPASAPSGSPWANYTVEQLYAFLSGCTLTNDPGTKFEYSNAGMGLLGHVIALKAGTNFESLVVDRICRPLQMDSTRITLTPGLKARLAAGHDTSGKAAPNWDLPTMPGAGALRSTASDLLKYVSANLGLPRSSLTPLMEKMQEIRHRNSPDFGKTAMPWFDRAVYQAPGMELLGHSGGTGGYSAFVGFDKKQRRGVVALSNQPGSSTIAWAILQRLPLTQESKTQFVREIVGIGTALDSDPASGLLRITKVFPNSPAAQAGLSAGLLVQKIDDFSTMGKSLPECLGRIRGPVGAKLRLELIDPERKATNTVELTRQKFLTSS